VPTIRYYKTFQNRLRWDLWSYPNPIRVCATCKHYNGKGCTLPSYPQNNLLDVDMYACFDHGFIEYLRPFFKEDPYKHYTSDQIQALRHSIAEPIDLSISCRAPRRGLARSYEIDNVDFVRCFVGKTRLRIFGLVRQFEVMGPPTYYKGDISIPMQSLEKVTLYKNGVFKEFKFAEFIESFNRKALVNQMEELDRQDFERLRKLNQL